MTLTRIEIARQQIVSARAYVRTLLVGLEDDDWYRIPPGGVSNVAWQIGHLTMAQFMLTLFRLRGKTDADEAMVPKAFLKRFLKGTQPNPDAAANLPLSDVRRTFDAVYDRLMLELPDYPDADLDAAVGEPYVAFPSRFGSLLFCAHHEMLHAGQIGMLRRLLGKPPVR